MTWKRMALTTGLTLTVTVLLTACTPARPSATPILLPTNTPVPSPTPIPTTTPTSLPTPLSVPGGTFSFEADFSNQITVTEQSVPIESEFSLYQLQPDQYVLYTKVSGDDQEIWVVSLDRKIDRKWIVCQNCPINNMELENSHRTASGWEIVGRSSDKVNNHGTDSLFIFDTSSAQIRWVTCTQKSDGASCGRGISPQGQWMYFYTRDLYGKQNSNNLYFFSIAGERYQATGELSGLPLAWTPDESEYVSMTNLGACPGQSQKQTFLVSLDKKQVIDLSASMCQLDLPGAHFLGWSPDGKTIALSWDARNEDWDIWRVDAVSVCPAERFFAGDVSGCKKIVTGLSLGRGDYSTSSLAWLTDNRFLWSNTLLLEASPGLVKIGTVSQNGKFSILHWLTDSEIFSASPDGNWVLAYSYTTNALGAYALNGQNPHVIYLISPANQDNDIWIQVP